MQKGSHHFRIKVIGTGDGTTFEELLLSMSEIILETIAKTSIGQEGSQEDGLPKSNPTNIHSPKTKGRVNQ